MRQVQKTSPVSHAKALTDSDVPGAFEALVSVFDNVDSDGDIVAAGAFTKTLAAGPKPIVWSHDWMLPPIGETLEATETAEGLLVKGRLFVADDEDHSVARQVYAGMKAGALREFSWGGRVTEETRKELDDGRTVWVLQEVDLVEYGPCLKGANPETRLVAVKNHVGNVDDALELVAKAGRVLSQANENRLRTAHASIGEVLSQLEEDPTKTSPRGGVDPEHRLQVAGVLL